MLVNSYKQKKTCKTYFNGKHMHLKAKNTTFTISHTLLMLWLQLHSAHTAFWQEYRPGKC